MFGKGQAQASPETSGEGVGLGISDFSPAVKSSAFSPRRGAGATGQSIIGPGVAVTGDVTSKGDVLLEGEVQGNIRCQSLHVAQHASLLGDVAAEQMILHGRMTGSIRCNEVLLKEGAYFEGDIACKSLAVEQGAAFLGQSLPTDGRKTRAAGGGPAVSASTPPDPLTQAQTGDPLKKTIP